ncbi:unnamed protein product [Eruca vesicaria subsp. sativa]|uniref:Uncharacterized protein n=1 Tax=Eruca vesicaria subsp. sativa TaxID=29727 RepID=A0ABC8K712_ERUVS|nr:unnamed protein product [Eruca vesicaria subsp. sativa]
MDGSDFFQDDCNSIATEMKGEEERIRQKRRWLLGLDTPKPENPTTEFLESEDHTPGKTEFLEYECLPESLLREDDLFYETAKSRVEEAFGICKNQEAQRKDSKFCNKDVVRKLSMYLDSLTNEGLSLVVEIITGGSTSFDKTRPKMKQIIRESVKKRRRYDIVELLHQALSDPGNLRKDCTMDSAKPMSHRDAALNVLDELDKLSTQTLLAMKGKLEGSVTIPPRLKPSQMGKKKMHLIDQVKQASEKMLSELSAGEKLQEPLAKAMSLVDLSLKLSPGYNKPRAPPTDFFHFSPETKTLQNEIVKAVLLLRTARIDAAFERVGLILDPEAQVSNHSLRSAVERMLIHYLFECCDMDVIPKSLTNALSLVNNKTTRSLDHRVFPGEAIEEETGCILNVSAQLKQIVWQCIPDYELDQDFGDAYMEELEESDDDDYSQDYAFGTTDPDQDEVVAECSVLNSTALDATNQHHPSSSLVIRDLTESSITRAHPRSLFATPTSNKSTPVCDRHDRDNHISPRSLYSVENIKSDDHCTQNPVKRKKNQYLAVQEICDGTSLVAYNLIGRLLEKFADQKSLELQVDERSYLRGESRLQKDVEGEVSEENKASDESITLSAVQEIYPPLIRVYC